MTKRADAVSDSESLRSCLYAQSGGKEAETPCDFAVDGVSVETEDHEEEDALRVNQDGIQVLQMEEGTSGRLERKLAKVHDSLNRHRQDQGDQEGDVR